MNMDPALDDLSKLIAGLPREDLEEIILTQARQDRTFELSIRAGYEEEPSARSAAELRESIREELDRYRDRWGMIDYRSSFAAVHVFDRLYDQAQSHLDNELYGQAFAVTTAVFESATEAMTYADDSAGELGGVVRWALDTMRSIAEADIGGDLRREIVEYVERAHHSEGPSFPNDSILDLWSVAVASVRSTEEYRRVREALLRAIPPESSEGRFTTGYTREHLMVLTTHLMERFGDERAAETIRQDNRHLIAFRKQLLSRAWEQKEYAQVVRLAAEGIAHDADWPGLVAEWRVWAFEAYQAAGDRERAQSTARDLMLAGDEKYLPTLKSLVSPGDWPRIREDLIAELQSSRRGGRLLPVLFVLDELWERLMDLVESEPYLVLDYGMRAFPYLPDRVRTVWSALILREARATNGRNAYRHLAESLRRYGTVVGRRPAVELRDAILQEFRNRPAMRDELSRL